MQCHACLAIVILFTQQNTVLKLYTYIRSLYILAMAVMVILILQERKYQKRGKKGEPNIEHVDRRRIDGPDDKEKHEINQVTTLLV